MATIVVAIYFSFYKYGIVKTYFILHIHYVDVYDDKSS